MKADESARLITHQDESHRLMGHKSAGRFFKTLNESLFQIGQMANWHFDDDLRGYKGNTHPTNPNFWPSNLDGGLFLIFQTFIGPDISNQCTLIAKNEKNLPWGGADNNRSVMPLDFLGRTRATPKRPACSPFLRGTGNLLNLFHGRDWSL